MAEPIDPLVATVSGAATGPASDGSLATVGPTLPRSLAESSDPVETTHIGRYVVLEKLGQGGMGVVLAAYDPKLDRKVAIKLIHAVGFDDQEQRRRMEREAQAMAKLSHPNVVTVHEVGEFADRLFLVMELVKGQDLRAWLRGRRGSDDWRGTLAMFLQAGEGLAAAHRAGVVHRDFKPDNVLIGEDGRARVGDFGLARQAVTDDETAADRARVWAEGGPALALEMTKAGTILGTPAYMAPEQFICGPTDERTDQFAFCVALWEALHGQRPFAGATTMELMLNVIAGRRAPAPAGKHVPTWLRRVVERGLCRDPRARWPTTAALLAALRADPTRRRRIWAGVACAGLVLAGALAAQHRHTTRRTAACVADGASITAVWNDEVRTRLRDGLLASHVAYAATTADHVLTYLDAQASEWQAARTEACLDRRVRGVWSEELLDQSTWCLDAQRMELEALISALSRADAGAVQKAVSAAARLSRVGSCRDAQRLARLPPLPDVARREDAREVLVALSRIDAQLATGTYQQGVPTVHEARETAEAVGWAPLTAAVHLREGALLGESGSFPAGETALMDGYFAAVEGGALELVAEAATQLAGNAGVKQVRPDAGLRWADHADAVLTILDVDAYDLRRAALDNIRAKILAGKGDSAEAVELFTRALALRERALGVDHPDVAMTLGALAAVHIDGGRYEEALRLQARALTIRETALGPDHPAVAGALVNLAAIHRFMRSYDSAGPLYVRALAIMERAHGPEHPNVAIIIGNLAAIRAQEGRLAEAKAMHERGLAITEKTMGREHPEYAAGLSNLAAHLLRMGEPAEAKALYERSLAIRERALGPDHAQVAWSLSGVAEAALALQDPVAAIAPAQRAVRLREVEDVPAEQLAESRFLLAQALWDAPADRGRDRARARALARQAHEVYQAMKGTEAELARLAAFLAKPELP